MMIIIIMIIMTYDTSALSHFFNAVPLVSS